MSTHLREKTPLSQTIRNIGFGGGGLVGLLSLVMSLQVRLSEPNLHVIKEKCYQEYLADRSQEFRAQLADKFAKLEANPDHQEEVALVVNSKDYQVCCENELALSEQEINKNKGLALGFAIASGFLVLSGFGARLYERANNQITP